jgi:hypothetical protein
MATNSRAKIIKKVLSEDEKFLLRIVEDEKRIIATLTADVEMDWKNERLSDEWKNERLSPVTSCKRGRSVYSMRARRQGNSAIKLSG